MTFFFTWGLTHSKSSKRAKQWNRKWDFLPHKLPTKKQAHGGSFAHHYSKSSEPTTARESCLLQLPGLRQLSHSMKEQKLNQVICQVIKTELEQSLRNT